jgi:hypothetical protein
MGQTETTRQSDEILPAILGSTYAFAVTSTLLIIDLASLANTAALPSSTVKGSENSNPLGQYLTLYADGATVYYTCGQTWAALNSASLAVATTNTVSASTGVVTASNVPVQALPSGIPIPLRFPPGPSRNVTGTNAAPSTINGVGPGLDAPHGALSNARFLGVLTASGSTSTLRINVSSR